MNEPCLLLSHASSTPGGMKMSLNFLQEAPEITSPHRGGKIGPSAPLLLKGALRETTASRFTSLPRFPHPGGGKQNFPVNLSGLLEKLIF